MSADIPGIQSDLRTAKLDGWLFYDFRGRDPIAQRILDLPEGMRTRRWFYFVPAKGTPKKLVHKIEAQSLAALPGDTLYYAGQDELRKNVGKMLGRAKNVAMHNTIRVIAGSGWNGCSKPRRMEPTGHFLMFVRVTS